jgi:hypothetical protein
MRTRASTVVNRRSAESGLAIVEFAMTIPIFILIALCGFEFADAMRDKQIAQALGRAAARQALACTATKNDTAEQRTTACLSYARSHVLDQAARVAPTADIRLSMYTKYPGESIVRQAAVGGAPDPMLQAEHLAATDSLSVTLNKQQVVVLAEVIMTRSIIFQRFGIGTLYDATIM